MAPMSETDLRQIAWMRQQWRRFRQLLWGATGAVWLLCCTGIILANEEQLLVRLALLLMLLLSSIYAIRLWLDARREIKGLERQAIELRVAMNEQKKGQSKPSRS
jgi:hypothetical protein